MAPIGEPLQNFCPGSHDPQHKCVCNTPSVAITTIEHSRPSWDSYFMTIAWAVSTRATCPRRSVGAIIVKDKRILATGFNGSPPGHPHCTEEGCWIDDGHCVRVIHAEHNAVLQGARYGISLVDAECYCTTLPCLSCAKVLVSAGLTRVVYGSEYGYDERLTELKITLEPFVD